MSYVWQTGWLGQNTLPGLPNQVDSVVYHCDYSFSGGLLWSTADHGEVELAQFAEGRLPHAPLPNSVENLLVQGLPCLFQGQNYLSAVV